MNTMRAQSGRTSERSSYDHTLAISFGHHLLLLYEKCKISRTVLLHDCIGISFYDMLCINLHIFYVYYLFL
jgi:hypothetical protein